MRIFIITFEPFPVGMAATNRILSLAKGLAENGASVKVICTHPPERSYEGAVNNVAQGTVERVDFEYPCGTTVRGETFLRRRRLTVKGIIRTLQILIGSKNTGEPVVVMQYLRDPKYVLLYYFMSRLLRMRYVRDVSEYPIVTLKKSLGARVYQYLYSELMFRLFDAVLVMTKPLELFFTNRVRRSARLMMLPMT